MKHFNAEKPDLKIESKFYFLFICFLLFPIQIFPQINIDGFCKYSSFKTLKGFNNVLIVDYNKDKIDDYILYGKNQKKFVLHTGTADEQTVLKEKFFFYPITYLQKFNSIVKDKPIYLFVSRHKRLAGLVSITKFGTLQLLNQIDFSSYPSAFELIDLEKNNELKALVYGENFEGLTILKQERYKLVGEKIISEGLYSSAKFIDLDYDGYKDIVAVDIMNNSLRFFNNNQFGEFRELREIMFNERLSKVDVKDYNEDGYKDIIILHNDGIELMYGDSVSSFQKRDIILHETDIKTYKSEDLNSDGNLDYFCLTNNNKAKLFLSNSNTDLFDEVIIQDNVNSKFLIQKENQREYLFVSEDGRLNSYKKISSLSEKQNIHIGESIFSVKALEFNNDFKGLVFLDRDRYHLSFLLNDKNEICTKYFSIPFSENYSNLEYEFHNKDSVQIYLYGRSSTQFEKFDVNISKMFYENQFVNMNVEVPEKFYLNQHKDYVLYKHVVDSSYSLVLKDFTNDSTAILFEPDSTILSADLINDNLFYSVTDSLVSIIKYSFIDSAFIKDTLFKKDIENNLVLNAGLIKVNDKKNIRDYFFIQKNNKIELYLTSTNDNEPVKARGISTHPSSAVPLRFKGFSKKQNDKWMYYNPATGKIFEYILKRKRVVRDELYSLEKFVKPTMFINNKQNFIVYKSHKEKSIKIELLK